MRIPLSVAAHAVGSLLADGPRSVVQAAGLDEALSESFPASDPVAIDRDRDDDVPSAPCGCGQSHELPSDPVAVTLVDGTRAAIGHGHVVIAAITSCTNTSNPSVMIGAGLLAKNAVQRGLSRKPWVKTTLAPGSRVVTDYYDRAGLTPYLERLGFSLVGYGCTTCIGNSGPLIPQVSAAVTGHDLTVCSVLSGNRNFEGRIHPECKMNFLTSPPLVIAYALTGTMLADLLNDPLGTDPSGQPVYLRDIWPSTQEVKEVIDECVRAEMFTRGYADVLVGDDDWRSLDVATGQVLSGVRLVQQYQKGIVFRFGRLLPRVREPGLQFMVPFVDRMTKVSVQTVVSASPAQGAITATTSPSGSTPSSTSGCSTRSRPLVNVENYPMAVSQVAQTSLRSVIGHADLDTLLSDREESTPSSSRSSTRPPKSPGACTSSASRSRTSPARDDDAVDVAAGRGRT